MPSSAIEPREPAAPLPPGYREVFLQAVRALGRHVERTGSPRAPCMAAADLYSGPLGPALFWAASARALGDGRSAERSLESLRELRLRLAGWVAEPASLGPGMRLGGICGLGAAVYALVSAADLLECPELLSEAAAGVALVTPERIARDRSFDLVHGCAGTILALLALEEALVRRGSEMPEGAASIRRCADHLLASRSARESGTPRAWGREGRLFCGFAHGAAGIAYALLRAYRRLGEPAWLDAAREAMAFERRLYRPEQGTWAPHLDFPPSERPMTAWCWGAPGIALGRLAGLEVLDEPAVRDDLQTALRATRAARPTREDHLCCGNFGRAAILAYAGRALPGAGAAQEAEALQSEAVRLAYDVLRRARGHGGFGGSAHLEPEPLDSSFFRGASGMAYALLDLVAPGILPLPLILEPTPAAAAAGGIPAEVAHR